MTIFSMHLVTLVLPAIVCLPATLAGPDEASPMSRSQPPKNTPEPAEFEFPAMSAVYPAMLVADLMIMC